jgi:hypothetical protein
VKPGGRETLVTYNDRGFVTRIEDQNGFGKSFKYSDSDGQFIMEMTTDAGLAKRVTYDSYGEPLVAMIDGQVKRTYVDSDRKSTSDGALMLTKKTAVGTPFESTTKYTYM